jgi:hypothetical protein
MLTLNHKSTLSKEQKAQIQAEGAAHRASPASVTAGRIKSVKQSCVHHLYYDGKYMGMVTVRSLIICNRTLFAQDLVDLCTVINTLGLPLLPSPGLTGLSLDQKA